MDKALLVNVLMYVLLRHIINITTGHNNWIIIMSLYH